MQEWNSNQLLKNSVELANKPRQWFSDEQTESSITNQPTLPVVQHREELIRLFSSHQVVIVCGETGSGKSTQIPQFLVKAGLVDSTRKLAVTQPRRLAASSLATRVAQEMGVPLGSEVGYSVRFDNRSNKYKTVVKFVTDGMLLRECVLDPRLSEYGAILIDEAHERTVDTDVLMGLIRQLLSQRRDFRLIVSSATMDAGKLSLYFSGAPIYLVPGRAFPVDILYKKVNMNDNSYRESSVATVAQIHNEEPLDGDILVFLPGQSDIELVEDRLIDESQEWPKSAPELIILPLYASMTAEMQSKIFKPTPQNCRKVILATNVAETSLTVPQIKYVVDTGLVKRQCYNPLTAMDTLETVQCSQASANQRSGRAGRTGPGRCYRLYSKAEFEKFREQTEPEILRSNLSQVSLLLLTLGIEDPLTFPWIDSPAVESVISALQLLYALGAVNKNADLTKLGRILVEFPVDPKLGKALVYGVRLGCISEVATVAAMLGELGNIFVAPKNNKIKAKLSHRRFYNESGDHLTLLAIYRGWEAAKFSGQWCRDHFFQARALQRAQRVRAHLLELIDHLKNLDYLRNLIKVNSSELCPITAALVSGYFMHLARLSKNSQDYVAYHLNTPIAIHPSSTLWGVKPAPKLLIYHELVLTSKEYMRGCLSVSSEVVREIAPQFYFEKVAN